MRFQNHLVLSRLTLESYIQASKPPRQIRNALKPIVQDFAAKGSTSVQNPTPSRRLYSLLNEQLLCQGQPRTFNKTSTWPGSPQNVSNLQVLRARNAQPALNSARIFQPSLINGLVGLTRVLRQLYEIPEFSKLSFLGLENVFTEYFQELQLFQIS